MNNYSSFGPQSAMMLDSVRNEAYFQAIKSAVKPDSVVLDLGAGLGIHGLMAAKLGAKKVYLVEPEDVIHIAKRLAAANGLEDRVECIQGRIEDVTLPEKVDIIISVFTGNFLLMEDLLPSLFHARDLWLKPGGTLIPDSAVMQAVPILGADLYAELIECWSDPYFDLDISLGRQQAANRLHFGRRKLREAEYLADPTELAVFDFTTLDTAHCQAKVTFNPARDAICHGFAGWFKMSLAGQWLSTAPHHPAVHWRPAFLPLDPPIQLTKGSPLDFSLHRPPKGFWTWTAATGSETQKKSTFVESHHRFFPLPK
jgi:SAM-dependent methyltransferase